MSAKTPALVVDAVVRDAKIAIVDDFAYRVIAAARAKSWGDGTALKIRIEPEDDAIEHWQYKRLFGHVYKPVAESSGHSVHELNLMAKALWMPDDGRTSLTQLNKDELSEFMTAAEIWLREEYPDAFLYEEPTGAAPPTVGEMGAAHQWQLAQLRMFRSARALLTAAA